MQKEFAFFPGCVLTQAAIEAKMSIEAIAPVLGITLKEMKIQNQKNRLQISKRRIVVGKLFQL